jgi:hypothetical protein
VNKAKLTRQRKNYCSRDAMRLKSFNLLNAVSMRQRNDPSQAEHDVPLNQSAQRGQATTLLRCRKELGRPLIG